jgi:hypothetical protein
MNVYKIGQLEVYVKTYQVEATSEAEAIVKLFDGEGVLLDTEVELADLCDDRGLPADEHPALAASLRDAGIMTDQSVIPSIFSIEQVE